MVRTMLVESVVESVGDKNVYVELNPGEGVDKLIERCKREAMKAFNLPDEDSDLYEIAHPRGSDLSKELGGSSHPSFIHFKEV